MGIVALDEIMPTPKRMAGDDSWDFEKLGIGDYMENSAEFLCGYVMAVIERSLDFKGKRPGGVVFLSGGSPYDMYELLDKELEAHPGPYVGFGMMQSFGYRISFYKWERAKDGKESRNVCASVYHFTRPKEVRDVIGPTIRGMLNEVSTNHETISIKVAGVDVNANPMEYVRKQKQGEDYTLRSELEI